MQTPAAPSPFRVPPAEPMRAGSNEFSVAVAKLIERRGRIVVERPPILPRFDPAEEEVDVPARRWLTATPVARGVALVLPLAGAGIALAWLLFASGSSRPSAPPRSRPAPVLSAPQPVAAVPATIAESRPETAALPSLPEPLPAAVAPPEQPPASRPAPAPSPPLARDEVKEVQSRLTALGFPAGPPDGVAGPQTQAALRRYADSRRLPGRDLDRDLLLRLRGEPAKAR